MKFVLIVVLSAIMTASVTTAQNEKAVQSDNYNEKHVIDDSYDNNKPLLENDANNELLSDANRNNKNLNVMSSDAKLNSNSHQNQVPLSANAETGSDNLLSRNPICKDDIQRLCGRSATQLANNLAVLTCIQNDRREEDLRLSDDCHHLIWSYKRNLTNDNRFSSIAKSVCKHLMETNGDCLKTETENNVLSPSANLLSCLIERLDPDTDVDCKSFLVKMEIIIFSDYRLIHHFTDHCSSDIEKFKCGRLSVNPQEAHTQGHTIECLEKSTDKLTKECRHQILRIAELQSDDYHLDRALYFSCRDDRERFCPHVHSGEGRVYRCLMRHKLDRELSRECREKLFQREMLAMHDYKVAPGLAKVCRNDIRAYSCRDDTSDQKEIRLAQILLCLEDALSKNYPVNDECRSEMLVHRRTLLENYNLTPDLVSACESDIEIFCKRLETGGKTLHCLMSHAKRSRRRGAKKSQISETCRRELENLLKEANVGEDWRVDPVLQESCQTPVDKLCNDVQPGDGRVLSCLMDHIDANHMSVDCRDALLQIQYFVSRDFHLDAAIYRSCHENAEKFCHAKADWHNKPDNMDPERGPTVLACLYRYAFNPEDNVKLSRQCLFDIRRVMKQRAISVDLMPDIEESCIIDLAKHCSEDDNIKRGFEMQCLQDHYDELEKTCKEAIGNFTEVESQHLELNYPLFKACDTAIKEVCTDTVNRDIDEGDLIECLILNKNKPGVKKHPKCRVAVEHFQLLSLKDFRFSFKFKEVCKSDVLAHCRTVKTKFEVVACLSSIVYNDTMSSRHKSTISLECRNQLRVELLQRSESIKLDPVLEKACEVDIKIVCVNISPGQAQVLECLKNNLHKLRKACQRVLFKRERIEMTDNSVDYSLLTNCRPAITKYCTDVELKEVLFCLRDNRDAVGMDQRCRSLVIKRLASQNTDYRLNPRLKSACQRDIPKFCAEIITRSHTKITNSEQQQQQQSVLLEGEVISCLKKQYILNKLSQSCEIEVLNIIREVGGNVELDPILYNACEAEIKKLKCNEESDVEECLKVKFHNREISDNLCLTQVARLITEVKADIQSDPLLYKLCAQDLKQYCDNIPPGHGRQLSCLLAVQESSSSSSASKLSEQCETMLVKRVEMFEYAAQVAPIDSVAQVVKQVVNSPQRNYFLFVLFSFVTFIFAGGLFCGRFTKPIATNDKIK